MSDVDVIVLDVDGGAMLQECLSSIERQTMKPNRIIVFDNGSQSPTPHAAARSEKNLGFAGGVNAALKYATSPFVALINNDVVLDDDWLETVRNAMNETPLPASGERVAEGRVRGVAAIQTVIRRDANIGRGQRRGCGKGQHDAGSNCCHHTPPTWSSEVLRVLQILSSREPQNLQNHQNHQNLQNRSSSGTL